MRTATTAPPPTPPPPKNLQFSLPPSATITIELIGGSELLVVNKYDKGFSVKDNQEEIAGEEDDSNRRQDNLLEVAIALTLSQQSLQSYLKSSKQKLTFKRVNISKLQKFSERAETTNEDGIRYLFGTTGTKSKKLRGIDEPKRQIQSVKWLWSYKDLDDDLKAANGTLLEEPSQNSNLRRNKGKYEMTDDQEDRVDGSIGQCDRWCGQVLEGMDRVNGKRENEELKLAQSEDWSSTVMARTSHEDGAAEDRVRMWELVDRL
ncbi:hypothetical protein BY996DRAFT_6620302 [Phakopsora pachyrhizi]|nr:hypothetical protein BY996DRAFT_6620302 [Phakopsora pachyrhizi]